MTKIKLILFCTITYLCYGYPMYEDTKQNSKSAPNYRLDTIVKPQSYVIYLTPYFEKNEMPNKEEFTFDGNVIIWIRASKPVDEIVLHAKNLNFSSNSEDFYLEETQAAPNRINVLNIDLDDITDKLSLKLESKIKNDTIYMLSIKNFVGKINDDMKGFYKSYYIGKDGKKM